MTRDVEGIGSACDSECRSETWVIMESFDLDSGIGGIARFSGGRAFSKLSSVSSSIIGLGGGMTTSVCVRGYGYDCKDERQILFMRNGVEERSR